MNVNYIYIMDFSTSSIIKIKLEGEIKEEANNCEDFDVFIDKLFKKVGVKDSQCFFMTTETDNELIEETYDSW